MAKKVSIPSTLQRKTGGGKAAGVKRGRKKQAGAKPKQSRSGNRGPTRAERLSGVFGGMNKKQQRQVLRTKKPEKHH